MDNLKFVVESLLFASEKPVTANRIKEVVVACGEPRPEGRGDISLSQIRQYIDELNNSYQQNGHSFNVVEIAGGFQIRTRPEYHPYLVKLNESRDVGVLSNAALETLSIIAYKQPIMKAEIESIRGVDSGAIIRGLMEKKLVRIAGHGESLGRPLLYGTTNNFLELLGLPSLKDLPKIEEVK